MVSFVVLEGRIEMIGGGWVMHDEADTSLWSTANQMTIGLDFLAEKLDVRPRWAWHIDPFGHSGNLSYKDVLDALHEIFQALSIVNFIAFTNVF